MFGVLLSVCLVPAVLSIIVTDPPPTPTSTEYNYSYNVVDPRTGDTKSLHEVRRGDVVTGAYTVIDPDGSQRVVEYTADSRRGFKAVVHSEPLAVPFHDALISGRQYVPRGNTHYLNQYYSSHTSFRGHHLPEAPVAKTIMSSRQKIKTYPDYKQTRYFIPASEIKRKPFTFKRGQYFAPNN